MYLILSKKLILKIRRKFKVISTKQILILIGFIAGLFVANQAIETLFDPPNCYLDKVWNDKKTLPDINDDIYLNSRSSYKNVFFHETSCIEDGVVRLNARQACAIESTARTNPDHNIYVLFTSQVGYRNKTALPLIDALRSYPNVHINYLNITKYAEDTPLQEWIKTDKLYRSRYVVSHTSDVLRFLSMWKYGGTYLDLDVVTLKSLNTMSPYNYAGAQSDDLIAVGIMHMEGESGHKIADMCVHDLLENFNGRDWASNGPKVLTRVLNKICGTKDVYKMTKENICKDFKVLSTKMCYSLHYTEVHKFFRPEYNYETLDRISDSLIAHVWNKLSVSMPLDKDSDAPYIHIAKKNCPKVFETCEVF